MEKNNYYDEDMELSDSEDVFDFRVLKDIVEDNDDCNSNTSSSGSEIIPPKRGRMMVIESESEESLEDLDEWRDVTEEIDMPDRIPFNVSPKVIGPQIPTNIVQPIQYFKLFFTNELVNEIIKETNNYAENVLRYKEISSNSIWQTWRAVEEDEFWAFIGVIINMGMIPLANMQEYWSVKENSHIPFFSTIFTRKRIMQIFWMLHLKTPDPAKNDIRTRIQRASNFLEPINSRFSDYFIPGENICVDESVVKFKGKISFITYNPNKPTKWGIRVYVLADSETGYVYSILPYYGSITSENLPRRDLLVSTRITLHLYQQLLDRVPTAEGYHMHTDRYYTSIPLAEELRKLKCHLTGTIQTNRKGVPTSLKKPKLIKKKTVAYKRGNTMLLAWRDNRIVTLLSNWHNAGMITTNRFIRGGANEIIEKPSVAVGYTKSMGGVDRADQYASCYCFLRMSLKWWRKLFFWGMEISIINSYILYKTVQHNKNEKALTHLKYRKILVDQLVGDFRQERTRVSTSISEIRLNGKLHIMRKGSKRDCVVCSTRKQRDGRRQTSEYCDTCPNKPRMHMGDCFKRYHTMVKYKI
ncbi:piggyBac transposable element-derived protein 4-like [Prorops nasuta]|uniref:piggyBac transposable element-derived protein 4-like n=1 Tax=Prorops nasuta TaxID=863751 RepID=UPI0034CDAC9F